MWPWVAALALTAAESWLTVQTTRYRLWVEARRAVCQELHDRHIAAIQAWDAEGTVRWRTLWEQASDQFFIDIGLTFRRWHPWLYKPWVSGGRDDGDW